MIWSDEPLTVITGELNVELPWESTLWDPKSHYIYMYSRASDWTTVPVQFWSSRGKSIYWLGSVRLFRQTFLFSQPQLVEAGGFWFCWRFLPVKWELFSLHHHLVHAQFHHHLVHAQDRNRIKDKFVCNRMVFLVKELFYWLTWNFMNWIWMKLNLLYKLYINKTDGVSAS